MKVLATIILCLVFLTGCLIDIAGSPVYPPDTSGTREACGDSCLAVYNQCIEKNTQTACSLEYMKCENVCIANHKND
jgi:hypothetical protein